MRVVGLLKIWKLIVTALGTNLNMPMYWKGLNYLGASE